MKNKFKELTLKLGEKVFTSFALSTSASACAYGYHQPEEPKCLREE